jgi:uncharacterized membrane protein YqjE
VGTETVNPLDALNLLRSAGGALATQAALYGELVRVEWTEEKLRLQKMVGMALLMLVCLGCLLLALGGLALAFAWDTPLRIPVAVAVVVAYGLGLLLAWQRFQALAAQGVHSFAGTREELAADIALLRSQL